MDVWTPVQDKMLILKRKPMNFADKNAVAVFKENKIVGLVPYNVAPSLSHFLKRDVNMVFAKVAGEKLWTWNSVNLLPLWARSLHWQDEGIG